MKKEDEKEIYDKTFNEVYGEERKKLIEAKARKEAKEKAKQPPFIIKVLKGIKKIYKEVK